VPCNSIARSVLNSNRVAVDIYSRNVNIRRLLMKKWIIIGIIAVGLWIALNNVLPNLLGG